jgi:contactin associated protein 1
MCSCGIAKMCVDPSKNCNCDAIVPVDLVDEGNIMENKTEFILLNAFQIFFGF